MNHIHRSAMALVLCAAVLTTACTSRTAPTPTLEHTEKPGQTPEVSRPAAQVSQKEEENFDPFAVGLLSCTHSSGPLPATAIENDIPFPLESRDYNITFSPLIHKVCIYDSKEKGYHVYHYDISPQDTVGQLAKTVLSHLFAEGDGITVGSVRAERSMIILDLALTQDSPAYKALQQDKNAEIMLNSLAATMNQCGYYSCGFGLNGGAFSLGGITLKDDGYGSYQNAPPLYRPITVGEASKLRQLLPLPLPNLPRPEWLLCSASKKMAEEHSDIYALLYMAGDAGTYSSPEEIPNSLKVAAGLRVFPDTYRCINEPEFCPNWPEDASFLAPLVDSIYDTQFQPQEWVEAGIQKLWGPSATATHDSVNGDTYHPLEGVYTPPHRGGGFSIEPYIHHLEETPSGYVAEVSYLHMTLGGIQDENGQWLDIVIPEDEEEPEKNPVLGDLLTNRLPRYQVTIERENGALVLRSCHLCS